MVQQLISMIISLIALSVTWITVVTYFYDYFLFLWLFPAVCFLFSQEGCDIRSHIGYFTFQHIHYHFLINTLWLKLCRMTHPPLIYFLIVLYLRRSLADKGSVHLHEQTRLCFFTAERNVYLNRKTWILLLEGVGNPCQVFIAGVIHTLSLSW